MCLPRTSVFPGVLWLTFLPGFGSTGFFARSHLVLHRVTVKARFAVSSVTAGGMKRPCTSSPCQHQPSRRVSRTVMITKSLGRLKPFPIILHLPSSGRLWTIFAPPMLW